MAKRHRFATRTELAELLRARMADEPLPSGPDEDDQFAYLNRVLVELEQLGVHTDALVKVTVDEPAPDHAAVFRTIKP